MEIVLTEGYTDTQGLAHRNVTFGKRLKGADYFALDENPQSEISTQYQLLIARATITAFGTLTMPVPLEVLLKLDSTEIQDLLEAHTRFMVEGLGEHAPEFLSDSKVKLAFGLKLNDVTYNVVEFGNRLNGYDLVEADKTGFASLRRAYFLIGREITKLSTEDGAYSLDGPIDVQTFEGLDAEDFVTLKIATVRWRESFRKGRGAVQAEAAGRSSDSGLQDRMERERDTDAAE